MTEPGLPDPNRSPLVPPEGADLRRPVSHFPSIWHELERDAGVGYGPDAVMLAILSAAFQYFPAVTAGAIYLLQAGGLARPVSRGAHGHDAGAATSRAAEAVARQVTGSGEAIVVELSGGDAAPLVVAAQPLKAGGRLVAVMTLTFRDRREFGADDQALLERLNQQAGVAIDSAWLFELSRRQVQELTVLHLVALAAAEATHEDELIARATQIIGAELFPDNFGLLLLDAATGRLSIHPSYQGLDPAALPASVPLGAGLTGAVAASGQPIRMGDVRGDPRFFDIGPTTLSELVVPLKVGARVLGVINAESGRANAFSAADEQLLVTLAGQLAIAIDRLRVSAAERRALQRAADSRGVLYETSQAINASLEPEHVYTATHRAVAQLMPCDAFTIALLDDTELRTELVYAVDRGQRVLPERSSPREGLTGYVLATGQPVRLDRLDELETFQPLHIGGPGRVQSLVAVPMRLRGKVFGMLAAQSYAAGAYVDADTQMLSLLANQAAVAIEHARLFAAEREQRQLAVVLHETGAILSASLELDAVLDRLLEQVERVVPFDTGTIFLVEDGACRMARLRGYERYGAEAVRVVSGLTLPLASTPTLRTLVETGQPLVIPDVRQFPGWHELSASAHIRAWIGAPMIAQGETIAVFALDQTTPGYFHARHAQHLALFAGQAALAVKNALLFEAQRQRVAALTALHEVGLDVGQQLDLPALLRTITERAVRLVQGDAGGLYLLQPDGTLEGAVSHNLRRDYTGLRLQVGEGVAGQVAVTGETIVVGDYQQFRQRVAAYEDETICSAIGTPVRAHGQVVGVLVVTHAAPNRFRQADAEIVALFGDQAAAAIVNARLYAEVRANAQELGRLFAASQDMAASREPQLMLEALARHVTEALEATSSYIVEVDLERSTIEVLAEYWSTAATATEHITARNVALPLVDYPHAERSARQQVVVQFNLSNTDLSTAEQVFLNVYGVQSELIVPVLARGQTLGLATIWDSRGPRTFTAAEIRLAQTLARQGAEVIENARLFTALEEEKRRLELLYHLSQSLTATLNLGEVASRALELVCQAFSADEGAMFAAEDEGHPLVSLAYSGPSNRLLAEAEAMAQTAARASERREIVHLDPVWGEAGATGSAPPPGRDHRSLVAVPLQIGSTLVAVIVLASRSADFGRGAQLPMLIATATPMALALQNAQLFDAEARRAHTLEALNEISRAAVGALDFQSLLQTLAARLSDLLTADLCYLALWDETRRTPIPAVASQPQANLSPLVMPPAGERSVTEAVLDAGQALTADDVRQAAAFISPALAGLLVARSVIALPLISGSRRLGAAIVEFHTPHHFTVQEVARAEQAARLIALAIARAELFEETRRRADEVTAATEVLRALNAMPDVREAFPAILRGLSAISRCQRVRLSLFDQDAGLFHVMADDVWPATETWPPYRVDELAAAADVLAGREHLVPDLGAERDYLVEAGLYAAGCRSSVTLPLRAGSRVVGALRLCWTQLNGYRAVNLASLVQIADAIALALEKTRLFAETRRRADELATLVSVSAALRAARTTSDMLPIFLRQACEVTGAIVSTLFMLEPDTRDLVLRGSYPPDEALIGLRQRLGEGIAGLVAETGRLYMSRDLQSDPRARMAQPAEAGYLRAVCSSLTVPLSTHEGIVGVLHVGRDQPHDFEPEEIHLLTAIAEIAGNALQRANMVETLEQRVAERTRALAEANARLTELDRLKDQFISNVSHELRTPLTNIKLHLSLLERRGTDALGRYLPTIQRETERLRRLIEDLLDLSRLQAQIAAPSRQPQVVDHLLAEVVALHVTRAEARGLRLSHLPALPPISAALDRPQLLQVFTNLVGNAIAYTPTGGDVEISSVLAPSPQAVPGVLVRFKNWPAAIPATDLPHLFDRFFRGQTALESGEAGTGLGLAICKEIVELHGGQIWVDSTPQAETTVSVWLPLEV